MVTGVEVPQDLTVVRPQKVCNGKYALVADGKEPGNPRFVSTNEDDHLAVIGTAEGVVHLDAIGTVMDASRRKLEELGLHDKFYVKRPDEPR